VTPERWARIKEVFGAALEAPASDRPRLLAAACAGDAELRAEVERLLRNQDSNLQSPVGKLFTASAELSPDDSVAHYRIQARLGAGGMGVVYRAEDTKLGRAVALKFLPLSAEEASPAARERFLREARAASALNHPNICTIHGVEESGGQPLIVMELIHGETLAARIAQGPMSLALALRLSVQIAAALAKAHAAGIIHRDLKPSNVMVTPDGLIKVLDFGLAKFTIGLSGESTRTLTTQEGTIAGTAAYMSPEQAEGKPVDARSDIFSFGALLYEMVTGRRAFAGDSFASTLAAVIKDQPKPPAQLVPGLPHDLEALILRCLEKNPGHRWQAVTELSEALRQIRHAPAVPHARPCTGRWRRCLYCRSRSSRHGSSFARPATQVHHRRWCN